jgi:hypothetical protein
MEGRTVLERVEAAFTGVAKPPHEALMNHHCCECLETSKAFRGAAWWDVNLEQLLAGRETALLTVEAWRYYLPAVIAWSARDPRAVDGGPGRVVRAAGAGVHAGSAGGDRRLSPVVRRAGGGRLGPDRGGSARDGRSGARPLVVARARGSALSGLKRERGGHHPGR